MLDLGPKARLPFIVAFLGLQLGLIVSAELRPDRVFGFRMFNESSSLKFELHREVEKRRKRRRVPVVDGAWQARTPSGQLAEFRWRDRVRYGSLRRPAEFVHAPYGLDAQVFRLQHALDDVVAHIADDGETLALVAEVELVKNGRPAGHLTLRGERP